MPTLDPRTRLFSPRSLPHGFTILVLAAALMSGSGESGADPPVLIHPGRWTPVDSASTHWSATPVHMALMPGDSTSFHSLILTWRGSPGTIFEGQLYGWNPTVDNDCSSYPSPNFTLLPTPQHPGFDIFCSLNILLDSRLLVVGGTDARGDEIGITKSALFHPVTRQWKPLPDIKSRRWYPSGVRLGSAGGVSGLAGGVAIEGGSGYSSLERFGGRDSATGTVNAEITRFQLTVGGGWDNTVTATQQLGSLKPVARAGHSAVWDDDPIYATILFGGQKADNAYTNELWFLRREPNTFGSDYSYAWGTEQVSGGPPAPRAQHVAAAMKDGSMVVFGGAGLGAAGDSVLNDVWWLRPGNPWIWTKLSTASPSTPGARQGHSAIYDPDHDRVLVFGGASNSGASPTFADDSLWSLKIDKTIPTQPRAVWSTVPLASGSGHPAPRMEQVMIYDDAARSHLHHPGSSISQKRALMYGGRLAAGLTDEVWTLWIASNSDTVEWRQPAVTTPVGNPGARARHAAGMSSVWMVTLGGERSASFADTVWALDLANALSQTSNFDSLTWRPLRAHPAPREDVPAVVDRSGVFARRIETFSPTTLTWDTLASASLMPPSTHWYPYLFQLPGPAGRLFHAGASRETYQLDSLSAVSWHPYPDTASSLIGGSAVMYRPGQIMKCGTRDSERGALAVATTQRINFNDPTPHWITCTPMDSGRVYHNLTLLPSGEVLASGGTARTNPDSIIRARYRPELWKPDSTGRDGLWYGGENSAVRLALEPVPRNYHANALMLPDARVLSGSGNAPADSVRMVSLYCPPYLFNASSGTRATRPIITAAQRVVAYGVSFDVGVDTLANISRLALVRAGSATHGFNFDQRYDTLAFHPDPSRCTLVATAPGDPGSMPPGEYLLFALNRQGVPSIASWVRLKLGANGTPLGLICPGGSCPFVDSRTAAGWQVENSVLARSLAGALSLDAYRLKSPPEIVEGRVQVRLRENEQEYTTLDQVRLAAVDHAPELRAFASGSSVLLGTRVPAARVTTRRGVDITSLVSGTDGSYFVGEPGETLTVQMYASSPAGALAAQRTENGGPGEIDPGDKGGEGGTRAREATQAGVTQAAAVDALILGASGIRIQAPDGAGGWRTLETRYPREQFDEQVLDSLSGDMRLIFIGRHRLRFVGHIEVAERREPQLLRVLGAHHSRLGDQLTAVAGAGASTTALTPGDTLTLEFAAPPVPVGQVRDWIVLSNGVYTSVAPARQQAGDGSEALPVRFALLQNRPNPFSHTTAIHFELPRAARVKLEIFDLQGRRVRRLAERRYEPGRWSVEWDQRGGNGERVRPGIYLYRIDAGDFRAERKMVLTP